MSQSFDARAVYVSRKVADRERTTILKAARADKATARASFGGAR